MPESTGFEQWFFTPEQRSALLPIGIAVWMLLRRRARLRAHEARSAPALGGRSAPALAGALLAAGVALFVWAQLAGTSALLLPSLAANLLAFAAAAGGRGACRALLLPALVLCIGAPIPAPLRDELVWRLQVASANGATWLLQTAGADVVLGGVQIHSGDYAFTVIETCSGLRGIEILTLIALAIRELFGASGARSWIVVAIAPGLGFALNVLRIVAVVLLARTSGAEGQALESLDHTPQGLAVLVAGTALLYGLGRSLAGAPSPGAGRTADEAPAVGPRRGAALRAGAAVVLALLAIASVVVGPLPRSPAPPALELPLEHAGWRGEDRELDRVFVGQFLPGQVLHRRYRREPRGRPPQTVDLLVGTEAIENPSSRLLSPKLRVPEHDWTLEDLRPVRLWLLGLDAQAAVASRDGEVVLAYLWRLRDRGLWRETARAALALDAGPLRRERRRVVVRLSTPIANPGPDARDRGKQTLDRFVADFRELLAGL